MSDPIDETKPTSDEWSMPDGGDAADETGGSTTPEWLTQLQSMIDNVTTQARPVLREVAAKAAELAAVAGEKAGPIAHKAAEVTAHAGTRVAERGREVAADLRRDAGDGAADESVTPVDAVQPGADIPPATTDSPTSDTGTAPGP